jgi:hypothetical protein
MGCLDRDRDDSGKKWCHQTAVRSFVDDWTAVSIIRLVYGIMKQDARSGKEQSSRKRDAPVASTWYR